MYLNEILIVTNTFRNNFVLSCMAKMENKATGQHFNEPGHSVSDMTFTVIEKIYNNDPNYRKQREKMWINKFNTKYKGLNKISGG